MCWAMACGMHWIPSCVTEEVFEMENKNSVGTLEENKENLLEVHDLWVLAVLEYLPAMVPI